MQVETRSEPRPHVAVIGEVDADNCAALGEQLRAASRPDLDIDASEMGFIDSSGLSELLAVREHVTSAGGSFVLRDPTPAVRRVIDIAGLLDHLGVR